MNSSVLEQAGKPCDYLRAFGFRRRWKISLLAERLSASQEGIFSTVLFSWVVEEQT
jgi:hypothetical protein